MSQALESNHDFDHYHATSEVYYKLQKRVLTPARKCEWVYPEDARVESAKHGFEMDAPEKLPAGSHEEWKYKTMRYAEPSFCAR
jgi:hypothetical protein